MFKRSHVLALTVVTLFMAGNISGCASLIIGGAATAGVAAYQERGISGVAADTTTATKLRAKMLDADEKLFREVGIEVYEGRVLLTGRVTAPKMSLTSFWSARVRSATWLMTPGSPPS